MNEQQDHFYRGQVFGMLETRLDRMEKDEKEAHEKMQASIDDIRSKINWIYGFAAAVGLASGFLIDWIKKHLGL